MSKLFYENQKLVTFVLKKFVNQYPKPFINQNYDDLRQEGLIGLWKAAMWYDESKGLSFSTYAVPMIRGYMNSYIEKILRSRRKAGNPEVISLETPLTDGGTIGDLLPAPEKEDITWILEDTRLTDRQRKILRLKYDGYTQEEIGAAVGCAQTHICREIKKIADILRDDFKE